MSFLNSPSICIEVYNYSVFVVGSKIRFSHYGWVPTSNTKRTVFLCSPSGAVQKMQACSTIPFRHRPLFFLVVLVGTGYFFDIFRLQFMITHRILQCYGVAWNCISGSQKTYIYALCLVRSWSYPQNNVLTEAGTWLTSCLLCMLVLWEKHDTLRHNSLRADNMTIRAEPHTSADKHRDRAHIL